MRAEHSLASSEARSAGNQIEFRSLSQSLTSQEFTRLDKNLNNVCWHKSCWSNRLCWGRLWARRTEKLGIHSNLFSWGYFYATCQLCGSFRQIIPMLYILCHYTFKGNLICILILSRKKGELGLKPSFTDLLIFLVDFEFQKFLWRTFIFLTKRLLATLSSWFSPTLSTPAPHIWVMSRYHQLSVTWWHLSTVSAPAPGHPRPGAPDPHLPDGQRVHNPRCGRGEDRHFCAQYRQGWSINT